MLSEAAQDICLRVIDYFKEESEHIKRIKEINLKCLLALKAVESNKESGGGNSSGLTRVERVLYETNQNYKNIIKNMGTMWKRAAAATGVSENTLRKMKKAAPQTSQNSKPRVLSKRRRKLTDKVDLIENVKKLVESILEQKGSRITIQQILNRAKEEINYTGSFHALRIIMLKLGYKYETVDGIRQLLSPFTGHTESSEHIEKKRKLYDHQSGSDDDKNEQMLEDGNKQIKEETDSEYEIDIKEEFIG